MDKFSSAFVTFVCFLFHKAEIDRRQHLGPLVGLKHSSSWETDYLEVRIISFELLVLITVPDNIAQYYGDHAVIFFASPS